PLAGARVQLFASNGTTEINVGPDGILGTADDGTGGVVTGAGGTYLFSNLPQGDYIVRVTPPVGYASTVDTFDNADTTNPNTNTDNNDNGVGEGLGQTSSNPVSLTPGSVGAASNNTVNNANGTTTNPTVDFGFRTNNGLAKTIINTNEAHTGIHVPSGLNNVAIGEIITYEIVIDLPVGSTFNNTTITDQLDLGLAFVDCVSVFVQGVDETANACPPAVTPAVGTSVNPADDGRQIVFTLPTPITVTAPAQQIVIQYRAIVLDVIENQDGVQLNNSVTWAWAGGSFTTTAPNVRIVEPDLAIDKSATPTSNVPVGTPVQFTLVIDHTTPQSQTDAFDVVVTDILPATLEYVQCTVQYTAGLAPDTPAATYCNPGATTTDLIFEWATFPLGQTSTITFNARLIGSPAVNEASVAWTSLPIDPQLNGLPVQLSVHNVASTERWYDPLDDVNIYSVSDSVAINAPAAVLPVDDDADLPTTLPVTGFAPNIITNLPEQPAEKAYTATDVWLEIPSLGVKMPIVGVPLVDEDWDVSWLWNQAGWLEGTAFPGWLGNSGLTSHVTLPNGQEGPFAKLGNLKWGDRIIVHAYGTAYIYEVRKNSTISPYNMTVLGHEEDAWLTLITCKNYNEAKNSYENRIAVRAVLIKITEDTESYSPKNIR
ncbi:MAG: sortase, partial [Anaerolineales bacterium]|nr:sortase [Anaerolineales bacterium]